MGLGLGHDQAGERYRITLTQKLETCVDSELGGMVVCHQGDAVVADPEDRLEGKRRQASKHRPLKRIKGRDRPVG